MSNLFYFMAKFTEIFSHTWYYFYILQHGLNEFRGKWHNSYLFAVFISQSHSVHLCTHACKWLCACLLLENCCGLFHTVSEREWELELHCNSNFEEEWIPVPEANFEEMKSCFAQQVVVYVEAYHAFHRTACSHNLNWTFGDFLGVF